MSDLRAGELPLVSRSDDGFLREGEEGQVGAETVPGEEDG
jgi:hypothetical protein